MEAAVITAVGIDVSKSKSTVAVRRPGGEIALRPFEVHHTNSDLKKLASTLKKLGGDIRIGTYQYVLETNCTDIEGSGLFCFHCQCDADSRF